LEAKAQADREQTLNIPTTQVEQNKTARTQEKGFNLWFSSALRLAYLHVLEEATKAWVSQTLSSSQVKSTSLLI
jgi:hypothetical protein